MTYEFGPSAFSRNLQLACALSNYLKPAGWVSVMMCLRGKLQAFDINRHISRDVLQEDIVQGRFLINAVRTSENEIAGSVLWIGLEPMPEKFACST
jgi:hypothetical protein